MRNSPIKSEVENKFLVTFIFEAAALSSDSSSVYKNHVSQVCFKDNIIYIQSLCSERKIIVYRSLCLCSEKKIVV